MSRRAIGPRWHDAVTYDNSVDNGNVLFLEARLEVTSHASARYCPRQTIAAGLPAFVYLKARVNNGSDWLPPGEAVVSPHRYEGHVSGGIWRVVFSDRKRRIFGMITPNIACKPNNVLDVIWLSMLQIYHLLAEYHPCG
jgi:hypothetical protein